MKLSKSVLALATVAMTAAPALAGQVFDSTTVGEDNSLSDGAGTTGPGMSGVNSYGKADKSMRCDKNGKSATSRIKDRFSRGAIYDNDAQLALPHIR
jgi:hypothetical protein